MRYSAPGQGQSSQQILATLSVGGGQAVTISNPGATPVWVSENQAGLDASVDASGTPQQGHIILPNSSPFIMRKVRGGLYARSVNGGIIECSAYPECGA